MPTADTVPTADAVLTAGAVLTASTVPTADAVVAVRRVRARSEGGPEGSLDLGERERSLRALAFLALLAVSLSERLILFCIQASNPAHIIIIIIIGIHIAPFPFITCSKALHIVMV